MNTHKFITCSIFFFTYIKPWHLQFQFQFTISCRESSLFSYLCLLLWEWDIWLPLFPICIYLCNTLYVTSLLTVWANSSFPVLYQPAVFSAIWLRLIRINLHFAPPLYSRTVGQDSSPTWHTSWPFPPAQWYACLLGVLCPGFWHLTSESFSPIPTNFGCGPVEITQLLNVGTDSIL